MPRGRPRTKPVRTTQVRKYTMRGTEKNYYSKASIAQRKANGQMAREERRSRKAAAYSAKQAAKEAKMQEKLNNAMILGSSPVQKRKYTRRAPAHTRFDEFGNPIIVKRTRAKKPNKHIHFK